MEEDMWDQEAQNCWEEDDKGLGRSDIAQRAAGQRQKQLTKKTGPGQVGWVPRATPGLLEVQAVNKESLSERRKAKLKIEDKEPKLRQSAGVFERVLHEWRERKEKVAANCRA